MKSLSYKPIYVDHDNRVLEINILPEKYCNFDCIFCPIGRSKNKTDESINFTDFKIVSSELSDLMDVHQPDLVFINSKGESFINDKLERIIQLIKSKHSKVKLLTNGYLLGQDTYREIANLCDEVIGEIKVTSDETFQKIQRPLSGYSLEEHVLHMASFTKQYKGKFIFEITLIKGYNDDSQSIRQLKRMIELLSPSELQVVRIEDEPFKAKLGLTDDTFKEISSALFEYFAIQKSLSLKNAKHCR